MKFKRETLPGVIRQGRGDRDAFVRLTSFTGREMIQVVAVTLRISCIRFQNSAGGVNARQGPRISIRTMP